MNYVPKCISKVLKFYWAWKLVFPRVKDWRSLEKQLVTQWCKVVWFKLDICDFFFFFAVKYYFLYFRTLVENLIIPFQLHLTVNRTTLSKAWGLWFSYTHDGCFVRHTVMCLATAATYFSRTLKKKKQKTFSWRGWALHDEARKRLRPGSNLELFKITPPPPPPLAMFCWMNFQNMVFCVLG